MSSSVFFKFKSSKEPQRIAFDGTGISVFELKREIIVASGLGDGSDFDLSIYNEESEEFDDDTTIIPRSTLVVARRLPAAKQGAGKAARYISGKAPVNARNNHRTESHPYSQAALPATTNDTDSNAPQTEADRIKAMFSADGQQWAENQKQMANAKPVFNKNFQKKAVTVPDHEPPPGYICYRCHEKGHWIQACPTNDDPNFKSQPRIKRTTGIPRSFLKTVEKPFALTEDGLTDNTKQPSGVMVNAEGEYVIAEPDKATWEQFQAKTKASAAQAEAADSGSKELRDRGLECPLDNRMFVEPMKTSCCGKTYCNECIENALVENDLVCPNCNTEGVLIDDLVADDEMTAKIKSYEDEKVAERKAKETQTTDSKPVAKDAATNPKNASESPLSNVSNSSNVTSNTSVSSSTPYSVAAQPAATDASGASSGNSKKRAAEEDLQNERKPSPPRAPAAMRRQQQAQQQQQRPTAEQEFIQQMNALANLPAFTTGMGMPGMYSSAPMMNMNAAYGMGMGMNGMGMGGLGMGMNMNMPMNMNMGMMNGYPGANGWNQQPHQSQSHQALYNGSYGTNMNQQQQQQQQQQQAMQNHMQQQQAGVFPNQQRNVFSNPGPNDEDAYFRKPVNPHRGRPKNRVPRPSDYTEL